MAYTLTATLVKNHSLGATFKSPWIDVRNSALVVIHMSNGATGTPIGTWTLEESNDQGIDRYFRTGSGADSTADAFKAVDITADTSRVTVNGSGLAVSSANNTTVNIKNPAAYLRLVYTRTSGTAADLTIWVSGRTDGC